MEVFTIGHTFYLSGTKLITTKNVGEFATVDLLS